MLQVAQPECEDGGVSQECVHTLTDSEGGGKSISVANSSAAFYAIWHGA